MDTKNSNVTNLQSLNNLIDGDLFLDQTTRVFYATDASAYRELPLGIVRPKSAKDVKSIVDFAYKHSIPLIPRTAGTSIAGQVVGKGLVVEIGRYMNTILEVNEKNKWVKLEPGVVLDELNHYLADYGLFFGPETSTSNRCMLGGMVGNNSCGSHSLIYGTTRDHLLEVKGYLSNGEEVTFKELTAQEFKAKCELKTLEGDIYRGINEMLSKEENKKLIVDNCPHPDVTRRNTGYALDSLMDFETFGGKQKFNMCRLIAGAEGTLFMVTEIKLSLDDVPPENRSLLCVHLDKLEDAFVANIEALKFKPTAVELMDKTMLDLAAKNATQKKNRFFIEGDPAALLLIELVADSSKKLQQQVEKITDHFKNKGYGYAFAVVSGENINKVWQLRKAGLGVLSNMPGDDKTVPLIEDTAVRPVDLPNYMKDIKDMLSKHGKSCVYYAHIGSGELHLRPILNLKTKEGVDLFYTIAKDTAELVKKYRGSLSGEHGDGRLRGEFIPMMVGDDVYGLFNDVKALFDKKNIYNPGKITDTPKMNTHLRLKEVSDDMLGPLVFNWESTLGMVRAAEKCNGSGDCRKSPIAGGAMCPSFMATKEEKYSTRGRANILREFFYNGLDQNKLDINEVKEVLSMCLACKACKSECPSNVDITKLRAEFLNYLHSKNGIPLKDRMVVMSTEFAPLFSIMPKLYNWGLSNNMVKKGMEMVGFSSKRTMPMMGKKTLSRWSLSNDVKTSDGIKNVLFLADEFTNYYDSEIGIKAVMLMDKLGYKVSVTAPMNSGRVYLSKGILGKAKKCAIKNIQQYDTIVGEDTYIVGLEPSVVACFRDEYFELVPKDMLPKAKHLSKYCLTFEEFVDQELKAGNIDRGRFTKNKRSIKFHTHCYQKALSSGSFSKRILEIPENYTVEEIPSGCCGMAGAFGYEKDHYETSMKVGELVLFPTIRKDEGKSLIVAAGTSCRHQIADGTGVGALHPAEVLFEALEK